MSEKIYDGVYIDRYEEIYVGNYFNNGYMINISLLDYGYPLLARANEVREKEVNRKTWGEDGYYDFYAIFNTEDIELNFLVHDDCADDDCAEYTISLPDNEKKDLISHLNNQLVYYFNASINEYIDEFLKEEVET